MHEIVNLRNVHTLVIIVNILILLTGYIIYNQLQPFRQTNQLTSNCQFSIYKYIYTISNGYKPRTDHSLRNCTG